MYKNTIILPIIVILIFYGCTTPGMPGYISESVSNFDNSKQISMEPAGLWKSPIMLSLYKNSKMPASDIVLIAGIIGIYEIKDGNSLHFNIDGDLISFNSMDNSTDIEIEFSSVGSAGWSSKRYLITKDFLNRLINANDVWIKIELKKEFAEGRFSSDAPTTARPAFKDFYNRIEKW